MLEWSEPFPAGANSRVTKARLVTLVEKRAPPLSFNGTNGIFSRRTAR